MGIVTERPAPTPPLSPMLLAGMAARPVPPALLQPLAALAMAAVRRRYPEVFSRLESLEDGTFLIDPVDLPFEFLLRPGAHPPSLTVLRGGGAPETTAVITAPLLRLIELLEGRADGDALFFSRDIVIEGDMEAVLTLRNAVDSAEIEMTEVMAAALGPFGGVARRLAGPGRALFRRMSRDMELLQSALLSPLIRRGDAQSAELADLGGKVAELHRRVRPERARRGVVDPADAAGP
jgi:predicted lipid carrier protein YhbT